VHDDDTVLSKLRPAIACRNAEAELRFDVTAPPSVSLETVVSALDNVIAARDVAEDPRPAGLWSSLPDEVLLSVLLQVAGSDTVEGSTLGHNISALMPKAIVACQGACRGWKSAALHPSIWEKLYHVRWGVRLEESDCFVNTGVDAAKRFYEASSTAVVGAWGREQKIPVGVGGVLALGVRSIAAGGGFSCVLTHSGLIYTWGLNNVGQCGHTPGSERIQTPTRLDHPIATTYDIRYSHISCSEAHASAVDTDGAVWEWGRVVRGSNDIGGEFGFGNLVNDEANPWLMHEVSLEQPIAIQGLQPARSVHCGGGVSMDGGYTVVVFQSGAAAAWGLNSRGQLGAGECSGYAEPTQVALLSDVAVHDVSCGEEHTLFLLLDGSLLSVGRNDYGELGVGPTLPGEENHTAIPVLVNGKYKAIAAGECHSAAIGLEGELYVWGRGTRGALGLGGNTKNCFEPEEVPAFQKGKGELRAVSCGKDVTGVVTTIGSVFTWGANKSGELGHGDLNKKQIGRVVKALRGEFVRDLSFGSDHALCLSSWEPPSNPAAPSTPYSSPRRSPTKEPTKRAVADNQKWERKKAFKGKGRGRKSKGLESDDDADKANHGALSRSAPTFGVDKEGSASFVEATFLTPQFIGVDVPDAFEMEDSERPRFDQGDCSLEELNALSDEFKLPSGQSTPISMPKGGRQAKLKQKSSKKSDKKKGKSSTLPMLFVGSMSRTSSGNELASFEEESREASCLDMAGWPYEESSWEEIDMDVHKAKVAEELLVFLENPSLSMKDFPMTYSSAQRQVVHELAEAYGLEHFSIGHGIERQVLVSKQG